MAWTAAGRGTRLVVTEEGDKRIVVHFRDKGRDPARTDYMSSDDAVRELGRIAQLLEESGVEGDQWIRSGTVIFRASDVHNISLEELVLPAFGAVPIDSIWNKQF